MGAKEENGRKYFILAGLIAGIIFASIIMAGFAADSSEKSKMVLAAPTEEVAAEEEPTTFYFDAATKNVEINGTFFPTETQETLTTEPEMAKFTAKAVVNGKTVIFVGEVPTTILEPLVAEFKVVEGTQVTKFPNGFVTATIE